MFNFEIKDMIRMHPSPPHAPEPRVDPRGVGRFLHEPTGRSVLGRRGGDLVMDRAMRTARRAQLRTGGKYPLYTTMWGNQLQPHMRDLYEAMRWKGQKIPRNFVGTIVFQMVTFIVRKQRESTHRHPSGHRIFWMCSHCLKFIPVGRIDQHLVQSADHPLS